MACSSPVEKDHFLSPNDPLKPNEDRSSSNLSPDNDDRGPASKKLKKTMSESKELFRKKNIVSKNKRKIMKVELSASGSRSMIRRTSSMPLVPPVSNGGFRRVSFLERSLFPGIKPDLVLPVPAPSWTAEQSKTAQLTIFYAGVINVYDDVPVNQAQAVMLLASQSCSSHPVIKDTRKADQVVQSAPRSLSPSLCETHEVLPIARRLSLQRFLDKRRDRGKCRRRNFSPVSETT